MRERQRVTPDAAALLTAWPSTPGWLTREQIADHATAAGVVFSGGRSLSQVLGELRRRSWLVRDQAGGGPTVWARTPTGMVVAASMVSLSQSTSGAGR